MEDCQDCLGSPPSMPFCCVSSGSFLVFQGMLKRSKRLHPSRIPRRVLTSCRISSVSQIQCLMERGTPSRLIVSLSCCTFSSTMSVIRLFEITARRHDTCSPSLCCIYSLLYWLTIYPPILAPKLRNIETYLLAVFIEVVGSAI